MTLCNIKTHLLITVVYYGLLTYVNGKKGYVVVDPRIVGGRPAFEGEAYYQLALLHREKVVCGAALALSPTSSEQIVLTAAHCVLDIFTNIPIPPQIISLRGDTLDRDIGGQTRNAVKVVRHEAFRPGTLFSDIAVIFLDEPFELNSNIQPVKLPLGKSDGETNSLTVSGWGKLQESDVGYPIMLQIVTVPVISNEVCKKWYTAFGEGQNILPTTICGGLEFGGMDACQGDSGGPAVGENSQGVFLAGIVSWGLGCGGERAPGVYTRVSMFVDWITEKTA